jgi:hypothetical protein
MMKNNSEMTFENKSRLNGMLLLIGVLAFCNEEIIAQYRNFHTVDVQVNFDQPLREWDGFGVTYVQTAHTTDYHKYPQEYGGFSLLDESEKAEIIDLIFGKNGLKPGIAKIFLDPLHQSAPGDKYNHELSTQYMLEFYQMGLDEIKAYNSTLTFITTLYGPPPFMTLQKKMRGRDFDERKKQDLLDYFTNWSEYLVNEMKFPLKYVSLHNEGDDWRRWSNDGIGTNFEHGHDYNMYWSPNLVAEMIPALRNALDKKGLHDVLVTPGETQNWFKFYHWGYADSIAQLSNSIEALGLVTSHGFNGFTYGRWYSGTNNFGTQMLRAKKPGLKAWVTSDSWGKMDINFAANIWAQVYQCEINGYIPWAVIQRPAQWANNDPNPGTAFVVDEQGDFTVQKGYYFYKQFSRAGQPKTIVSKVFSMDSELLPMGFASSNSTENDAFILINTGLTAPYRADMAEITLNGEKVQFSFSDPGKNQNISKSFPHAIRKTDDGFCLEFQVNASGFDYTGFNIQVFDGENSTEGIIGWKNDKQGFKPEKSATIPFIDGLEDSCYLISEIYQISEVLFSETSQSFSARWKAVQSGGKLFIFIQVTDSTNYQERDVRISLTGTKNREFDAYRTSENENYHFAGTFRTNENGVFHYQSPPSSVTTFFGK